jgi:hypothetical protein
MIVDVDTCHFYGEQQEPLIFYGGFAVVLYFCGVVAQKRYVRRRRNV